MSADRRRPLVAGNWKMHGSLTASRELVDGLLAGVAGGGAADMLLCPPAPYLQAVAGWIEGSGIALGGQNLCEQPGPGAYTGEIAGHMLKELGCSYVIVGHSERRALYGETDAAVATKFDTALAAGLTPILCVGESLAEREAGQTEAVVTRQVDAVLAQGAARFAAAVIAYEPVWAIGTGKTATPEQAQEVHGLIRTLIAAQDATIAAGLRILYGGSVKGGNASELFAQSDIDGGLVGGASLEASEFLAIYRAASG